MEGVVDLVGEVIWGDAMWVADGEEYGEEIVEERGENCFAFGVGMLPCGSISVLIETSLSRFMEKLVQVVSHWMIQP